MAKKHDEPSVTLGGIVWRSWGESVLCHVYDRQQTWNSIIEYFFAKGVVVSNFEMWPTDFDFVSGDKLEKWGWDYQLGKAENDENFSP